jgi:type 1 glutamine amidotransferase
MKKALIFRGGWVGHHPIEVSEVFGDILKKEGFSVEIHDTMDILDDADYLKTLDLIVPLWTMGEIEPQLAKNVCAAVESGVGLAGCHGGMCDAFRNSVEWQFLTGAQWVAHPGNDAVEYVVNLVPDTYFTEGLKDFKITSEQYYIHIDPAVKVYATTTFPTVDGPHAANGSVKVPVVFTKLWGRGRVFYTSLGHTETAFDIPASREMVRRGFLWASDHAIEA